VRSNRSDDILFSYGVIFIKQSALTVIKRPDV
jgi:hypothetical protein